MSSSHICLTCRRRLGQVRFPISQCQPRATFISLSVKARIMTDDTSKQEISKPRPKSEARKDKIAEPGPEKTKRRFSRHAADELESLFARSLKPSPADALRVIASSLEPYKHAETLKKMMSESYPLGECWAYFVEHFGPNSENIVSTKLKSLPSYLQSTSQTLLKHIVNAKRRKPFSKSLPTMSDLSQVHFQMGTLNASEWVEMILILLENISTTKPEGFQQLSLYDQLISDLLGAWNLATRKPEDPRDSLALEFASDWSHIRSITLKEAQRFYVRNGSQAMFKLFVPSLRGRATSIPLVALATYSLLTSEFLATNAQVLKAQPFLATLGVISSVPGLNPNEIISGPETDTVVAYVKDNWNTLRERALQKPNPRGQADEELRQNNNQWMKANLPKHGLNHHIHFVNRRLHAAMNQKNVSQVETLWSDVSTWPAYTMEKNTSSRGTLTLELCNYFILAYVGLRQPNRAIDVWNHMINVGVVPTVATWDAMLSGCKASGDWNSLEEIWKKMLKSGIQPDVVCWTTRISGLMSCKQFEQGIRALDEMGRDWLAAAERKHPNMKLSELKIRNDVQGTAKPAIATVNAAISTLMRHNKKETAQQILNWATTFGIKPDVITYNIYLRPLIRCGHTKEAMALLQQMNDSGIKPDVATFVTILDEAFRNSVKSDPEGQREVVDSIFTEMEQAGVEASSHIYGRIIFQLLRNSDANISIVNYVLERMAKQGLQPSVHIYTTLMDYHFNQRPPNIDAARIIIERATTVVGVDRIFWDKAVESYARLGETAAALRILGKLAKEKTRVGWIPLRMLLLALAENQEWELAKSVVRDAINDADGRLPDLTSGTMSQNDFWKLARDLNLLERESYSGM